MIRQQESAMSAAIGGQGIGELLRSRHGEGNEGNGAQHDDRLREHFDGNRLAAGGEGGRGQGMSVDHGVGLRNLPVKSQMKPNFAARLQIGFIQGPPGMVDYDQILLRKVPLAEPARGAKDVITEPATEVPLGSANEVALPKASARGYHLLAEFALGNHRALLNLRQSLADDPQTFLALVAGQLKSRRAYALATHADFLLNQLD